MKITTQICQKSCYPGGAFGITITEIPPEVTVRLKEADCQSISGNGHFHNIVENSALAQELAGRLRDSINGGPLRGGDQPLTQLTETEMFHILMLLDMYWD